MFPLRELEIYNIPRLSRKALVMLFISDAKLLCSLGRLCAAFLRSWSLTASFFVRIRCGGYFIAYCLFMFQGNVLMPVSTTVAYYWQHLQLREYFVNSWVG